jgi:hypothetical protein
MYQNIPKHREIYQMTLKYTKFALKYLKNSTSRPSKYIKIGILGKKLYHLATLEWSWNDASNNNADQSSICILALLVIAPTNFVSTMFDCRIDV